jgi:uncharacterized protein with von Willebrand factor type A (vWA) domain
MRLHYIFFLFLLVALGCNKSDSYPRSPEETILKFQSLVDENKFDEAAELCTDSTIQSYIDPLKELMRKQEDSSTVTKTVIKDLKCKIDGDRAVCTYYSEEEGVKIEEKADLVKIENKWKMNLQFENFDINFEPELQVPPIDTIESLK